MHDVGSTHPSATRVPKSPTESVQPGGWSPTIGDVGGVAGHVVALSGT
jgi:hypothetical protein